MKRIFTAVCFFIIASSPVFSAGPLSVSGSAEWDMSLNNNRNTVFTAVAGDSEISDALLLFLNPEISTDMFKFYAGLRVQKSLIYNDNVSFSFDQAYFNWNVTDKIYFGAGKRRLPVGYSYFWSPAFMVNPQKNVYNPELYSEGIPLFILGYTGEVFSPKLIWTIDSSREGGSIKLENSYYVAQLDFYLSGFEFFVNGLTSKTKEQTWGAGIRKDIMGFTLHAEGSAVKNNQKKYYIYEPAGYIAGDKAYRLKQDEWYPVFTIGLNSIIFDDGILILEYYNNKMGFSGEEFKDYRSILGDPVYFGMLADVMGSFAPGNMQQNYLFFSYAHTIKQKWNVGLRGLMSLDDSSGFLYPFIYYEPYANLQVGVESCFPVYANTDSEFGLLPFNSATMLKMKVFF